MFFAISMVVRLSLILWVGTQIFARLVGRADGEWVKGRPLLIMILFYAVGMFGQSIWVAYALLILSLPLLAQSRAEGAALFIIAIGSISDLPSPLMIGSLYLVQLDKYVCLAIALGIVVLIKRPIGPRPGARFHIPFLIMLALDLIQARNLNFTATMRTVLGVLLAEGLPYFAFVASIRRAEDLRRVILAICYLGFMLSVVGIFEGFSHTLFYVPEAAQLHINGMPLYRMMKFRGGILRAATSFSDATSFAQFLVIALIATASFRYAFRSTRAVAAALAVVTVGIFVTSTRNAWIGVLIGVMAFDIYRKRYVSLAGKTILLAMMYGTLLLLAEFIPYFHAMVGGEDTANTATYRRDLLNRGLEEFHKHPLLGVDPVTLVANMHDLTQGEGIIDFVNGYLFYALTAGFFGFIGLLLVFLLPSFAMIGTRRTLADRGLMLERAGAFVFSICMSYFVTTAFTGYGSSGSLFFYLTLGIGAVLFAWRRLALEQLMRPAVPSEAPAPILGEREHVAPLI